MTLKNHIALPTDLVSLRADENLTSKWPVRAKYGLAADGGFQAVPDLLLKHQKALGLSATDLVVLLNVLMHWWTPETKPFPRAITISKRMGVTPRTVQRSLRNLQRLDLIRRGRIDKMKTVLDPDPLVIKLILLGSVDIHLDAMSAAARFQQAA